MSHPFPALCQLKLWQDLCQHGRIWRNIFSLRADLFEKITCHSCVDCYLYIVMNKSYFTQSEDGTFRPVTFNQSNLADIVADVIGHEFKSALADKVRGLIDDATKTAWNGNRIDEAINGVDLDDIAEEAIRDEINNRVENLDISVDVSL